MASLSLYFIIQHVLQSAVMEDKEHSCSSHSGQNSNFGSVDSTSNSRSNGDLATWDGNVGIDVHTLLHVLQIGDPSLDLVDNILQSLLLRGLGRDSRCEHRDRSGQRRLGLCPLTETHFQLGVAYAWS